mgnify:CR=1 FL=1
MPHPSSIGEIFRTVSGQFLDSADPARAFEVLDQLCTLISQDPSAIVDVKEGLNIPALQTRTAEIDGGEEAASARAILSRSPSRDSEDAGYAWSLPDYYQSEWNFIRDHMPGPVKKMAIIGQGAIPSLAMAIRKADPSIAFDFFDIDPDAAQLSQAIMRKTFPDSGMHANDRYITADVTDFTPDNDYDLVVITNAPVPALHNRDIPLAAPRLFIRSATQAGETLYPRLDTDCPALQDYDVIARGDDPVYNIHEMVMLGR